MTWRLKLFAVPLLLSARFALAALPDGRWNANMRRLPSLPIVNIEAGSPVISRNGTELPPYNTTYLFDQLIDHNNPSLGTFKQRYWHTYEFYEPGGPIILVTPGEANAQPYTAYVTNQSINGLIAQQQNGSAIVLEHRFYGLSNPYPDLTVNSLKVHTIQQAIDDLEYFAKNVHLPMPNGDQLTPDNTPWILIGGSYSGALTSWTMVNKPNLFYAGYASSAVVEAILNFWKYFEPVREGMPKNCSADVQAVISHVDKVFTSKNTTAIQSIKDLFGLGEMTHLDDVAGALRNNLWDWQSLQPTSGAGAQFFNFCDALEVKDGKVAPVSGWGLDHALLAWGAYWKNFYLNHLCGSASAVDCLGTYNATQPFYTDTSIDNAGRSWNWIVCNEVGYLQEGAPIGRPSLVTRLVQPPYDLRQCQLMFPDAFPKPPRVKVAQTNRLYAGWNVNINRIFFANGIRDPWRDATVSAEGLNIKSTQQMPIGLSDGFHCSDLKAASGAVDATVASVQNQALAAIKTWLAAWKPVESSPKPVSSTRSPIDSSHQAVTQRKAKPVSAWNKQPGIF